MSAAACKQILCSWDATTSINTYLIDVEPASKPLRKAAAVAKDYLLQAIDLAQLLTTEAAGGFSRLITYTDAHEVIEIIEAIETELAGKTQAEAKEFLEQKATALHAALKAEHDRVTGESTEY